MTGLAFAGDSMQGKIITAGHICLDITPMFPDNLANRDIRDLFLPGKLIQMDGADVHTGGSVANTGLALKLIGNDVQLLGKIGRDAFGEMVKSILSEYGAGGLIEDENSSTSYSVVLSVPGSDRIFLHDPAANDSFCEADIPDEALENTALFHFGYPPIMRRMYLNDGQELEKLFRRVKSFGAATSLDMAAIDPNSEAAKADWPGILKKVLPYVDFFVPSFEEICFMLDRKRYERLSGGGDMTENLNLSEEAGPLADELLEMGCRFVLIKCGTSGLLYKSADKNSLSRIGDNLKLNLEDWAGKSGIQPCFMPETVRSATGAGDTSIAAFLTAVLRGRTPAESVALAAAEGACCVSSYDALGGLKPIDKLQEMINAGWKTYEKR